MTTGCFLKHAPVGSAAPKAKAASPLKNYLYKTEHSFMR